MKAGLFDVSHMLGVQITGPDRVEFAEAIFPSCIKELGVGEGQLTSLPNEQGGLIDDCIVTNMGDHLFLVINAGHEDKDLPHMEAQRDRLGADVAIAPQAGCGILALQGPSAAAVLAKHTPPEVDLASWPFMVMRYISLSGIECVVSRSGYTGEDGFEIVCAGEDADTLARKLLEADGVRPIGLGARDRYVVE